VSIELPDDYLVEQDARGVLAVRRDLADAQRAAGFGVDSDGATRASELRGRRNLAELDVGGRRCVLRRFSHGGAMRWLTGSRYSDPERPFRELADARRLELAGVATPEIVAARATRAAGGGWRLAILSVRIDGVRDGAAALDAIAARECSRGAARAVLAAMGELVAKLHARGFVHADLQPRNLLIDERALRGEPPRLWVIDLDRSHWRDRLGDGERRANLARLLRYVARAAVATRTDYMRFLRGYEPDRARRHADWRAVAHIDRGGRWLHKTGWWLERLLGTERVRAADGLRSRRAN
jgi:tRNA A-37 threonylcarbamoyl transferase component Bud32